MGYGVAMHTQSYRHLNAEERGRLSLGLGHGQSIAHSVSPTTPAPFIRLTPSLAPVVGSLWAQGYVPHQTPRASRRLLKTCSLGGSPSFASSNDIASSCSVSPIGSRGQLGNLFLTGWYGILRLTHLHLGTHMRQKASMLVSSSRSVFHEQGA